MFSFLFYFFPSLLAEKIKNLAGWKGKEEQSRQHINNSSSMHRLLLLQLFILLNSFIICDDYIIFISY